MSLYPCLDENRRYRSFPCSRCDSPNCWMGKKPASEVIAAPGERICKECGEVYPQSGRSRYCSQTCRLQAMYKRRRAKRPVGPEHSIR